MILNINTMTKKTEPISKEEKIILDEFFYHEAIDRTYILVGMLNDILLEHPVIQKHKKLKKRVKKAEQLLLETYQHIGGLEVILFPDTEDTVNK